MVVVICPNCGYIGSLSYDQEGNKKFWRVWHQGKNNCYYGSNPEETFTKVTNKQKVPVETGKEFTVDDDTDPSSI